tara:strand:- start:830 stop:1213 length:384 start_codon:yes stop_codon:yes gene_type:complete
MSEKKKFTGGIPCIPKFRIERQLQVDEGVPPDKTTIDPENVRTVEDMFELPEPQKRESLVDAVKEHILGVVSLSDIQYSMASIEERVTNKIPKITETQILTTDKIYKTAIAYQDLINDAIAAKENEL